MSGSAFWPLNFEIHTASNSETDDSTENLVQYKMFIDNSIAVY